MKRSPSLPRLQRGAIAVAAEDPRPLGQQIDEAEQAVIESDALLRYHADVARRRAVEVVRRGRWVGGAAAISAAVAIGKMVVSRPAPQPRYVVTQDRPRKRFFMTLLQMALALAPLLLPTPARGAREPTWLRAYRLASGFLRR